MNKTLDALLVKAVPAGTPENEAVTAIRALSSMSKNDAHLRMMEKKIQMLAVEVEVLRERNAREMRKLVGVEVGAQNARQSDSKGGRIASARKVQPSTRTADYSHRALSTLSEQSLHNEAIELAKGHQKGRPLTVQFSEALRVLMHHYNWSQKRVADTFGVSTGTAFNISNGTYSK